MRLKWRGMEVDVTLVPVMEGDASIPEGTRRFREIEDYVVYAPDGSELNNELMGHSHREICRMIAEEIYNGPEGD